MIGPEGGVLQTSKGVFVTVPAGAVSSLVTFYYRPLTDLAQSIGSDRQLTSSFELTARDSFGNLITQFAVPLQVAAPYTMSASTGRLAIAYQDAGTGDWIELPGRKVDGETRTVRGDTDHFTAFGVTETFESASVANTRTLFTDPLVDLSDWTLQAGGTAATLDSTLADGTGLWDFNAGVYYVTNSTNFGQEFTYRAAIQNQNEAGGSGSQFGGIVFGYQSDSNHWRLMKSQKKDFSNTSPPLVLVQCTGTPCGPATWTGYTAPTPSFTCTNCTVRAYSVDVYDPGPGDNVWLEVTLTASGANTLITGRAYADAGTTGCGATPCRPSATAQETLTFTATNAQYDHGAIGLVAQTAGQWAIAKPQAEGTLPADASGSWNTCMNRSQPVFSNTSNCTGNPGVIWDAETVRTGSTKTIQLFSGDTAYTGYAYHQFSLTAAGNYGVRAFIKPNAASPANNTRVQVCTSATTATACTGGTLLAETGPGVSSTSQECGTVDAEGWYDCQASFSVSGAQTVYVRLTFNGAAGVANFDNVVIATVPNSPTINIDGVAGDNKSVYATPDDHTAGGAVDLRVYGTTPTNGACGTCSVKVYDTVSSVTSVVGTYTDAQYYSLTSGSASTQHQPSVGGPPPVTHNYTAVYIDASGIRSVAVSATAFQIDSTAPTISVSVAPAANAFGWNNGIVTATFTCSDSETGIAASGCAGSASAGSGTAGGNTAAGVSANGTWTLSANTTAAGVVITGTATDKGGNTATVSTSAIKIDMTAPTATYTLGGTTGLNGWYTSNITVTWTCSDALSGMSFTPTGVVGCDVSGATTNTDGTSTATGVISADTAGTVVNILSTDQAGNSATGSTTSLGRDTTGPTSGVSTVGGSAPGASFNASTYTNLTTSGIAGTASDTVSGVADGTDTNASQAMRIALTRLGGGTAQYWNWSTKQWVAGALPALPTTPATSVAWLDRTATFSAGVTWSWSVPSANMPLSNTTTLNGWPEDTYTVTIYAQDSAGNVQGTASTATFTVDATAPSNASVVVCKTGPCGSTSDTYTNSTSVALHLHAEDGNAVAFYKVGESTTSAVAAQTVASGTAQVGITATPTYDATNVAFTISATEGTHYVAAMYRDSAGNWCCDTAGTIVNTSIILDTTAPTLTITSPATTAILTSGAMTITVTFSDALSGFSAAPTVTVDQTGPGGPTTATGTGCSSGFPITPPTAVITCTYTYTVTASVATDGPATITATVTDRATNTRTTTSSFTVDTQLPTIVFTSAAETPSGSAYTAGNWANESVIVIFTCSDTGSGIATSGCTSTGPSGSGTTTGPANAGVSVTTAWTLTGETSSAGVSVTGTATDKAGNQATATYGVVKIDLTPPTITAASPSAADGSNGWHKTNLTITFNCSDPVGQSSGVAGSGMVTGTGCQPTSGGSAVNTAGTNSGTTVISTEGYGSLTGTATDNAGNTASVTVAPGFYKLDKTPPTSEVTFIGGVSDSPSPSFNASNYTNLTTSGIKGLATDTVSGIADSVAGPFNTGADTNAAQAIRVQLYRSNAGSTLYWNPTSSLWVAGPIDIYLPATLVASNTWEWTLTAVPAATTSTTNGWPEDFYSVSVLAQDEAGWWQTAASVSTFTVDATVPGGTLAVNCVPASPGANCVNGYSFVKTTTIPLTVTATDGVNVDAYVLGQSALGGTNVTAQTDATARRNTALPYYRDITDTPTYSTSTATYTLTSTGDGSYWIAAEFEDSAGNWCCGAPSAPTAVQVILDTVSPTISILTPASGTVVGDVIVTIQVQISDTTSGVGVAPTVTVVQSGGASVTATPTGCTASVGTQGALGPVTLVCSYTHDVNPLGGDGAALITATGADQALNTASATTTIIVDTQPPTIVVTSAVETPSNTAYTAGNWANESVLVTFTCSDVGSGIATGGCLTSGPTGSGTTGGPGGSGASVTATWTVTGETSSAGVTVTGSATDKAGTSVTITFTPVKIDLTPPTISAASPPAADGLNGWHKTNLTITFNCSDPVGQSSGVAGSGMVTGTGCQPTAGGTAVNTAGTNSGTTVISTEGYGALTGTATDIAGNTASVTVPPGFYKLDKTAPTSEVTFIGGVSDSPTPGFNATNYTNLTTSGIQGLATDTGSGIADSVPGPFSGVADTNAAQAIRVQLYRNNAGSTLYWNPTSSLWVAGPIDIYLTASQIATSTWQWSLTTVPAATTSATNGWPEDTYFVSVLAQDEAGWWQTAASISSFSVDATAPSAAAICAYQSVVCTGSTSDTYINTTNAKLHLHAEDTPNLVNAYAIGQSMTSSANAITNATAAQGAPTGIVASSIYDATAVTYPLTGGDGTYFLAVQYRDNAANWCCANQGAPHLNQTAVFTTFILDTTAPSMSVTGITPSPALLGATVQLTVQVWDLTSGLGAAPTVSVRQNGGAWVNATLQAASCTFPAVNVTVTCIYDYPVITGQDGTAQVSASVLDRAGNMTLASGTFLVDTSPPTITASIQKSNGAAYVPGTWSNLPVIVRYSCTDAGLGIKPAGVGCIGSPAPSLGTQTILATNTWEWTYNVDVATTTVGGRAEDFAGNVSYSVPAYYAGIMVDLTKPSGTITAPTAAGGPYTVATFPNITGTASDALSGLQEVRVSLRRLASGLYWNGAAYTSTATYLLATGTTAWSITAGLPTGTDLPEGSYEVCVRALDVAGNLQSPLVCETVAINRAPYVTAFSPTLNALAPRTLDKVQITFSEAIYRDLGVTPLGAADYGTGLKIEVRDSGGVIATGTGSCNSPCTVYTVTFPTTTFLQENETYTIFVLGGAGGVHDSVGGDLGNSSGVLIVSDSSTFRTPNPASVPFASTASWRPGVPAVPNMPTPRRDTAAATANGRFHVFGGYGADGKTILNLNQAYDPTTNTWTTMRAMTTARFGHAAVAVGGSIYVIGGGTATSVLSSVEIYNAVTNSWTTGASLPAGRKFLAAAYDPGTGSIYAMGGVDGSNVQQKNVYKLCLVCGGTPSWTSVGLMPEFRSKFTLAAAQTASGWRLIAAGGTLNGSSNTSRTFDPSTSTWDVATVALPAARNQHGTATYNGYVYLIGGLDTAAVPRTEIYYLDPLAAAGSWSWQPVTTFGAFTEGRAAFGGQVAILDATPNPDMSGIIVAGGQTTTTPVSASVLAGQH